MVALLEVPSQDLDRSRPIIAELALKFAVSADNFVVISHAGIPVPYDDEKRPAAPVTSIVYAARRGILVGNPDEDTLDTRRTWGEITCRHLLEAYVVVDTSVSPWHAWDTRKGLTLATYTAMIESAKRRGVDPLPDSRAIHLGTFLTGENQGYTFGSAANVDRNGVVVQSPVLPDWGSAGQWRFRPAVTLSGGFNLTPEQQDVYFARYLSA